MFIPTWLISLLCQLAVKVGVPFLIKRFPNVPQEVLDIINVLLDALKDPNQSNSAAKKTALSDLRSIGNPGELKP